MDPAFVHVEILGPRSSLDRWLAVVQDHGGCHLADALRGLEGERGAGRPTSDEEGVRDELLRSEALGVLRGLQAVLPPTALAGEVPSDPARLRDESLAVATKLRSALEAARETEASLRRHDAIEAAVTACSSAGSTTVGGRIWSIPRDDPSAPSFARRLRRAGATHVAVARGDFESVAVVLPSAGGSAAAATPPAAEAEAMATIGAVLRELPPDVAGRPVDEVRRRLEITRLDLLRRDREATLALETRVRQDGPRARRLLDHLEDAEDRVRARWTLAALDHVAAARAFVRREDVGDLRGRLRRAFGDDVVVRTLAEAEDTPAFPRRAAMTPFGALEGLRPARLGETPGPAVLALWTPFLVAWMWADLGGGLLLLGLGALLGIGAAAGSVRREVAFLAQGPGLIALLAGIASGRAFGPAGERWFGTDWALVGPGFGFGPTGDVFRDLLIGLGAVAFVLSLWSALVSARHAGRGMSARARQAGVAALSYAVLAGAGASALGAGHALRFGWVVSAAAFVALGAVAGRAGIVRGIVDLAVELRLVAVGGGALLLVRWGSARLADLAPSTLLVGLGALVVGCVAFVVDAAHLAMSPPYDASVSGRAVAPPFRPFAKRAGAVGVGT